MRSVLVLTSFSILSAIASPSEAQTYYGLPIDDAGVAFVIDVSGSMEGKDEGTGSRRSSVAGSVLQWGLDRAGVGSSQVAQAVTSQLEHQGTKLGAAKRELAAVVMKLPPNSSFRIISFGARVTDHGAGLINSLAGRARLGQFTAQGALAIRAVESLRADGGTPMAEAVETALGHTNLFTVFILSDGRPTSGDVLSVIQRLQRSRGGSRARIHTIGVGADQDVELLCRIARENNGIYVRDGKVECSASPCENEPMILADYAPLHPDYHQYAVANEICQRTDPGCTVDAVFRVMRSQARFQAPTGAASPLDHCGRLDLRLAEWGASVFAATRQTEASQQDATRRAILTRMNEDLLTLEQTLRGADDLARTLGSGGSPIRVTIDASARSITNHTIPGHPLHPGRVVRTVAQRGNTVVVETIGVGTTEHRMLNEMIGPVLFNIIDGQLALQFRRR